MSSFHEILETDHYHHTPLRDPNNIRLICLEPAFTFNEEIRCDLVEVSVRKAHSYEALSYSWGEAQPGKSLFTQWIRCDGQRFPVSEGAFHALRRLRRPDAVRYLWIDAICIDQSLNAERSHQVQMMAAIYAGASEVLVWVGEDDDLRDGMLVMKFLGRVAREMTLAKAGEGAVSRPKLNKFFYETALEHRKAGLGRNDPRFAKMIESRSDLERAKFTRPRSDAACDSFIIQLVVDFLGRRWYERRWVVQEVYQAARARIICGRRDIELRLFRKGLTIIWRAYRHHELLTTTDKAILESAIELCTTRHDDSTIQSDNQPTTIFHKLCYCAHFKCSDPRDLVYSFLGIHNPFSMIPDYNASIGSVYYDFAQAAIRHGWVAAILFLAAVQTAKPVDRQTDESLPSWVPDWRKGVQFPRLHDMEAEREPQSNGTWSIRHGWVAAILFLAAVQTAKPVDRQTDESLPSWVPDWRKGVQFPRLHDMEAEREPQSAIMFRHVVRKNMEPKTPNFRPLLSGMTTVRAMLSSSDQRLFIYGRNLGAFSLAQGYANLHSASSTDSFLVKLGAPQQSMDAFDLFALDSSPEETLGLLLIKMTATRSDRYSHLLLEEPLPTQWNLVHECGGSSGSYINDVFDIAVKSECKLWTDAGHVHLLVASIIAAQLLNLHRSWTICIVDQADLRHERRNSPIPYPSDRRGKHGEVKRMSGQERAEKKCGRATRSVQPSPR
nr:heterokaryon incompatibility protein 6, or allele [Quercus suber]